MQAQKALFSAAKVGLVEVMQVALSYNCDVIAKLTDKVRHKALGQEPLRQIALWQDLRLCAGMFTGTVRQAHHCLQS